ncbi:hypothetical protein PAUR_a3792 [Pseudoalteromonas aurantia 208]|uniref:Uncharacterized protein n=1 Tax=Pseudoalteromonas aurantia 208 TaxID=1314867 RepID=A0ABR9E7F4_9GAMM|nr:hypothetical protein [Pseudoalteromonas aurantia 208]
MSKRLSSNDKRVVFFIEQSCPVDGLIMFYHAFKTKIKHIFFKNKSNILFLRKIKPIKKQIKTILTTSCI